MTTEQEKHDQQQAGEFIRARVERDCAVVRAKMVCNRMVTEDYGSAQYRKVFLGAIYGKEGENAGFAKATPSGECWLQIDADMPAAAWFKPNKRYYLTFTEAPD